MLTRTFQHVPGIGKTTEAALWKQGCLDWDCFLASPSSYSCGNAERDAVRGFIQLSKSRLERGEHQFFRRYLGMKEAWRAYGHFKHSCVYLDIETDGGTGPNSITTIGMYDGKSYTCLVKGVDLENFRDMISHYSMIVTFFGATFDVPVLEKAFKMQLDHIHVDLCPAMRRLGIRGGLKKIEKQFGIQRSPETDGLTGYDAVVLWRKYRGLRDDAALERLVAYNREDCVNLEKLADIACSRLEDMTLSAFQ